MFRWISIFGLGCAALTLGIAAQAGRPEVTVLPLDTVDREEGRVGRLTAPKRGARAHQHGSTIAVDAEGLWILERNAGALIRSDHAGKVRATLSLHEGLGELVRNPDTGSLFVADRMANRVLHYSTSGEQADLLAQIEVAEPFGLALTPDGTTLLVTSVADHQLVAIDTETMQLRWHVELAPEPRAVAVSPDGQWALVGFLSTGAIARVELGDAERRVLWHALSPRDEIEFEDDWPEVAEAGTRFDVPNDVGRRHARNVFALAFVGDGIAVAAHQVATPQMELVRPDEDESEDESEDEDVDEDEDEDEDERVRVDTYGGGRGIRPIEYRFARIAELGDDGFAAIDQHRIPVHQPRALAYDSARDVLYVAGHGDDEIVAIASASRESPTYLWSASLGEGPACGIDGLAIAETEGPAMQLWAHCELARRIVRIDLDPKSPSGRPLPSHKWVRGPELASSLRSSKVERGADLFRRADLSARDEDEDEDEEDLGNALACSSCHPEGRSDGLTWRLGRSFLQTPMLAGRIVGTSPYKWTGEDRTLHDAFVHTIERTGGDPEALEEADYAAIAAYLGSLAKPRPPTVVDADALERGREVFEDYCSACHAGELSTDRKRHKLTSSLRRVDTPSLIGVAHSPPYFHDGSAVDLAALLDDRGSVHGMIDASTLSGDQRADLVVYLESL